MKGSYRIIVQNAKIRYDFEIRRNITIIKGNSATGKTTLVEMIREYYEDGEESGISLSCEKECIVLAGRDWENVLAAKKDCIVFIDEGNRFVHTREFARTIQKTDNYYVIVTREGLVNQPYSVEEIYGNFSGGIKMSTTGFATIGTSRITQKFLNAAKECEGFKLVAVYSRDIKKAEKFAGEQGAENYYDSLDALVADKDVEAVYVASPNHMHYEHAMKLLKAGKHVLCEKAIASNYVEAEEMFRTAKEQGVILLEAMRTVFHPGMSVIRENLPKLGTIRKAAFSYCQYSSRYDKYLAGTVLPAFDPALSGGALYDINIYNLNLIIGLFGAPESVSYHANKGFNGIDTSGMALLSYPGFQAVAIGAKDSASPSGCMIQGEKGWLRIESSPNELKSFSFSMRTGQEKPDTFQLNRYSHRLSQEFEEFARIHAAQDYAARDKYLDISLAVAKVAELCRHSAGIDFGK